MRLPWSKPKADQLELLDADPELSQDSSAREAKRQARSLTPPRASNTSTEGDSSSAGRPLLVALDRLSEDPNNPRTEFPEAEINELAESIRQHGILQPLVVCPGDVTGHYHIHPGAKRGRAARRAGLSEVPVVVREAPADAYAQVAENQKRHGLTAPRPGASDSPAGGCGRLERDDRSAHGHRPDDHRPSPRAAGAAT